MKKKFLCGPSGIFFLKGVLKSPNNKRPCMELFKIPDFLCFRVDIPVDSLDSDYVTENQRKHNNYFKIRKTAKRGYVRKFLMRSFQFD